MRGGYVSQYNNMKEFTKAQFWEQYDLFSIEIDGITHYLAGDLNQILKNYRLELSNDIYTCEQCRAILTIIKDAVELEETTGNITKCVVSLVVEKDGSVSNVQLPRGVYVNADTEQEKIALENTLNDMIVETVAIATSFATL